MSDIWLNMTKDGSYCSIKQPWNKEEKRVDPWPSVHLSFSEMQWIEDGGKILVACLLPDIPPGIKVSKKTEEALKKPFVLRLILNPEGDSISEKALCKALKETTLNRKTYSGLLILGDSNPACDGILSGKKPDGSDITDADKKFLNTQIFNVMEVSESTVITDELWEKLKKTSNGNGSSWGKASVQMETAEDRFNFRFSQLKKLMGMDDKSTPQQLAEEWTLLDAKQRVLFELLLK